MPLKFSTQSLSIEHGGLRLLLNSNFRKVQTKSSNPWFRRKDSARIYENSNGDFLTFTSSEVHVSHGSLLLMITDPTICRELRDNFS